MSLLGRARSESAPGLGPVIRGSLSRSRSLHRVGESSSSHGGGSKRLPLKKVFVLLFFPIVAMVLFAFFIVLSTGIRKNRDIDSEEEMNVLGSLPNSKLSTLRSHGHVANHLFDSVAEKSFISLRTRFFSCDGCFANYPRCDISLTRAVDFLPDKSDLFPSDPHLMSIVFNAFSEWLCTLPTSNSPPHAMVCTYKRDMDNPFCEETVGKTLRTWSHVMLRYSVNFGLPLVHSSDSPEKKNEKSGKVIGKDGEPRLERFVLPRKYPLHADWKWMIDNPKRNCAASNVERHFVLDHCQGTGNDKDTDTEEKQEHRLRGDGVADYVDKIFRELSAEARRKPSVSSSILFQGLALRHLVSKGLGPCILDEVKVLLGREKLYVPRYPDGSKQDLCCSGSLSDSKASNLKIDESEDVPYSDAPVISMHIRRGDSCEQWLEKRGFDDDSRPCFATALYFHYALKMKRKYGACRILLATDDQNVVLEAQNLANTYGFYIAVLDLERQVYDPTVKGSKKGSKKDMFIENRDFSGDEIERVTLDSIADLVFLSGGDLLIGTGSSTMTRLAHQMIAVRTGRLPPFVSLDVPLDMYQRGTTCPFRRWT